MSISDRDFIWNLAQTCRTEGGTIRADGKERTYFQFVIDKLFTHKTEENHFDECYTQLLSSKSYAKLSFSQKVNIYHRISYLAGRLNKNIDRHLLLGEDAQIIDKFNNYEFFKNRTLTVYNPHLSNDLALLKVVGASNDMLALIERTGRRLLFNSEKRKLKNLIEHTKTITDEKVAVVVCKLINEKLDNTIFSGGYSNTLDEDYSDFDLETLFDFTNKHIKNVDRRSALRLKCQLAHLPADRAKYSNLTLNGEEVKDLFRLQLHDQLNTTVNKLCRELSEGTLCLSDKEAKKLAKLLSDNSYLNDLHRDALRRVVEEKITISDWNDTNRITECLYEKFFSFRYIFRDNAISELFYDAKILKNMDIDKMALPFWFHATKEKGFHGIYYNQLIEKRHERRYPGAWVSSVPERKRFGIFVFALSQEIQNETNVLGLTVADSFWRGLQSDISITKDTLSCVSCPRDYKSVVKRTVTNRAVVMSDERLDHLRSRREKYLGLVNVPTSWWHATTPP